MLTRPCVVPSKVAWREKKVSRNVAKMVASPKASRHMLRCFDEGQALAFLDAIAGHSLEAYFITVLSLCLRRGEGCALRWVDLDFERKELHISGALQRVHRIGPVEDGESKTVLERGATKTHRSERPLPMLPMIEAALKRQRARQSRAKLFAGKRWQDSGLVFGTPLEPRNVNRSLTSICDAEVARAEKAKEEPRFQKINVHGLRHSMVTLLRAKGIPDTTIAQLAGQF